jgi:hypothetical protein
VVAHIDVRNSHRHKRRPLYWIELNSADPKANAVFCTSDRARAAGDTVKGDVERCRRLLQQVKLDEAPHQPMVLRSLRARDLVANAVSQWRSALCGRMFRTWHGAWMRARIAKRAAAASPSPALAPPPLMRLLSATSGTLQGRTGLRNLGNTCYMNAAVQALVHVPCVWRLCAAVPPSASASARKGGAADALLLPRVASIVHIIWTARTAVHTPSELHKAVWRALPQFKGFRQHDVDEFLRALVESLLAEAKAKEENSGAGRFEAQLRALFTGWRSTELTPIGAPEQSSGAHGDVVVTETAFEGALLLSIPPELRDAASPKARAARRRSRTANGGAAAEANACTLRACLAYACELDALDGHATYRSIRRRWTTLPPVLIVQLVRTCWRTGGSSGSKLRTHVSFPLASLDMAPFQCPRPAAKRSSSSSSSSSSGGGAVEASRAAADAQAPLYDLCAVVIHHGRSLTQGHYTCAARCGELWYHFNDDKVAPKSPEWVAAQEAYVLFYERRSIRAQRAFNEW